jgi:hypothetical protein
MDDHEQRVTVGEVFRRLEDFDGRVSDHLTRIEAQCRLTNGRTSKLETRVDAHDGLLRDLQHPPVPPVPPELKELIDIARDAKGVVRWGRFMWAVGGALIPIVMWWLSKMGLQ